VLRSPSDKKAVINFVAGSRSGKRVGGEWALSMVGVEEGREFHFRRDLYSQESTFPQVNPADKRLRQKYSPVFRKLFCVAVN